VIDWADDDDVRRIKAAGLTAITQPDLDSLIARIDHDRWRLRRYSVDSALLQSQLEQRWHVRQELAALIGTEDLGEALAKLTAWRAAYEQQMGAAIQ